MTVPAGGWYALPRCAPKERSQENVLAEGAVEKVGVGEVFVAAGHSFCSGWNSEAPAKARDDRVATCAAWGGSAAPLSFRHCEDPLRPADGTRASPWPAAGDLLVSRLHVPVLLVNTGIGGTTVEEWLKGAADPASKGRGYPAFRLVLRHVTPYTGLRAVLWFGNENDLWKGPSAKVFSDNLGKLIAHSRMDSGCPNLPWVIASDAYFPDVASRPRPRGEAAAEGTDSISGPRGNRAGKPCPIPTTAPRPERSWPAIPPLPELAIISMRTGVQQLGVRFARKDHAGVLRHPRRPSRSRRGN